MDKIEMEKALNLFTEALDDKEIMRKIEYNMMVDNLNVFVGSLNSLLVNLDILNNPLLDEINQIITFIQNLRRLVFY